MCPPHIFDLATPLLPITFLHNIQHLKNVSGISAETRQAVSFSLLNTLTEDYGYENFYFTIGGLIIVIESEKQQI